MSEPLVRNPTSLIDLGENHEVDLCVVFMELDWQKFGGRRSPFWRLLKDGFRHVEIWKQFGPAWIRMGTAVECIKLDATTEPPEVLLAPFSPKVLRVKRQVKQGVWREPFFVGPINCVELAKAFLGVRDFFVRTPYQLYRYLREEV